MTELIAGVCAGLNIKVTRPSLAGSSDISKCARCLTRDNQRDSRAKWVSVASRFVKLHCGCLADVDCTTQFRRAVEAAADGRIVGCDLKGSGAAIGNLLGCLHDSTPYTGSDSHSNGRTFIEDVVTSTRARLVLHIYSIGNRGLMAGSIWSVVTRIKPVGGFKTEWWWICSREISWHFSE